MNFVALIGLITNIQIINNKQWIDLKISTENETINIARIIVENERILNGIEIGNLVGINGKIDFINENQIIAKSCTII
ncbi:MAG: hypothetical protein ACRCVI_01825 [Mycoplasmoidaceae bacterium]